MNTEIFIKPVLNADFKGILLVNKPVGLTSFKVVNKVKKLTKNKKVGHAGTLDPFAEGLLIIAVGREFTKQISFFQDLPKTYEVEIVFGLATDTYDSDGKVTDYNFDSLSELSQEKVTEQLKNFLGKIEQIPPKFSAKKINGKRAYDLARKEQDFEMKPNTVEVYGIRLLGFNWFCLLEKFLFSGVKVDEVPLKLPSVTLEITCSKGTYIRSIAYDLGKALGIPSFANKLKRTKIGEYSLEKALSYECLKEVS